MNPLLLREMQPRIMIEILAGASVSKLENKCKKLAKNARKWSPIKLMHVSSPNLPPTATTHGQTYTDLIGKKEEEGGMAKANSNVTICDTKSIPGVRKPCIEMEEEDGGQVKYNAKRTLVHHSTNSESKTFHLAMEEHNNQKQEGIDVGHKRFKTEDKL